MVVRLCGVNHKSSTDKKTFIQPVSRLICCICTTAEKLNKSASAVNT